MDSLLIVDQSKKYSTTRWTIYCGLLCPMQMCPGLHWGSQTETGDDWRRSGHLREKDDRQVSLSGTCMGQIPPHPLGVDIGDGPFKWHPQRSASNKMENWWLECVMRKHKGRNKPHWSLTSNDMYACMAISSGACSHFPLSPRSIQLKSPRKSFWLRVGNREPFHKQPESDTFACNQKKIRLEAFPARTGSSLQLCCTHAVLEVCTLAQLHHERSDATYPGKKFCCSCTSSVKRSSSKLQKQTNEQEELTQCHFHTTTLY